ncbi:MAG: abortive infection family protein [Paludibacteraceae bacterium]|nr:abortive infection family protein [Paludibacteraceae bacterium]
MNDEISPNYRMKIIQNIYDTLNFKFGDADVLHYIEQWHNDEVIIEKKSSSLSPVCRVGNFRICHNIDGKIDLKETLHGIDNDTLIKIAIDLGIETPGYIPCFPIFRNELKASYQMASQAFESAIKNVEKDPGLAVGLANTTLESIIKEILKDDRIKVKCNNDTLYKLTQSILKEFQIHPGNECPAEIKTLGSSLIACSGAIETLRSDKTLFHGATNGKFVISDPLYAYFIVNAVTTIGLFLLNFYKENYPKQENSLDKIPS